MDLTGKYLAFWLPSELVDEAFGLPGPPIPGGKWMVMGARSPSARRMTSSSPRALGDGRRRAPYRKNGKKRLMPGDGDGA
jgi:hypothetical protein